MFVVYLSCASDLRGVRFPPRSGVPGETLRELSGAPQDQQQAGRAGRERARRSCKPAPRVGRAIHTGREFLEVRVERTPILLTTLSCMRSCAIRTA